MRRWADPPESDLLPEVSKRRRCWRVAALLVCLACATVVLPLAIPFFMRMMTRPPPVERLVGVYVGRYYGGTETIEIRPNHTFQQTFVKGTNVVYRNSGTWQLSEDSVVFTPFMLLDEEHGGNPERLDGVSMSRGAENRQSVGA
jgi:hypothetical protein